MLPPGRNGECYACGWPDLLGLILVHESMSHDASLLPRRPPARRGPQARLRQQWRVCADADLSHAQGLR